MRGALKAAAARARFPFLAANVIDTATGTPGGVAERPAVGDRRGRRAPRGHRRGDDLRRAPEDARRQRRGARDGRARPDRRAGSAAPAPARRRTWCWSSPTPAARAPGSTIPRTSRRATPTPRSSSLPGACRPVSSTGSSPATATRALAHEGGGHPHRPGLVVGQGVRPPRPDRRARGRGGVNPPLSAPADLRCRRPRRVLRDWGRRAGIRRRPRRFPRGRGDIAPGRGGFPRGHGGIRRRRGGFPRGGAGLLRGRGGFPRGGAGVL